MNYQACELEEAGDAADPGCHQVELGDLGQRYEVRGYIESDDKIEVIGWTDDIDRARKLTDAVKKWPRYDTGFFIDRQQPEPVNECKK